MNSTPQIFNIGVFNHTVVDQDFRPKPKHTALITDNKEYQPQVSNSATATSNVNTLQTKHSSKAELRLPISDFRIQADIHIITCSLSTSIFNMYENIYNVVVTVCGDVLVPRW